MRSRSLAFLVALSCVVMAFAVAVAGPGASETASIGAIFPLEVRGDITDSIGAPIAGASVTVYVKRPDTTVRASYDDTTNSTGGYSVSFAAAEWEIGDTVLVEAEYDSESGSESALLESEVPLLRIDVTVGVVIPEFGPFGAAVPVAGALGIFMLLFFARNRRKS